MKSLFQNFKAFVSRSVIRKVLFGTYIAMVLGFSATSRGAELRFFPMPSAPQVEVVQLAGLLVSAEDGLSGVLVVNDQVIAELVVPAHIEMNLVDYHGQEVQIVATHSQTRIQPVVQGVSTMVAQDSGDVAVPTVFVLRIKASL